MRTISNEEFIDEMERGAYVTDCGISADVENNSIILSLTIQPAPHLYYVVTFTIPDTSA